VSEITEGADGLLIYWKPNIQWPAKAVERLLALKGKGAEIIPGPPPAVRLDAADGDAALDALGNFFRTVFA
jgi:hypothetical protein